MLAAGRLREQIVVQRATATSDDYGGQVESWANQYNCRAEVRYGTGQERRQAAQESATQTALFVIRRNPITDGLTTRDRIVHRGVAWDIVSLAPVSGAAIEITAARAA